LRPEFVEKELNREFLENLPNGVDPCGEYMEKYHTFIYNRPIFVRKANFKIREIAFRDEFYYMGLISTWRETRQVKRWQHNPFSKIGLIQRSLQKRRKRA